MIKINKIKEYLIKKYSDTFFLTLKKMEKTINYQAENINLQNQI